MKEIDEIIKSIQEDIFEVNEKLTEEQEDYIHIIRQSAIKILSQHFN